MSFGSLMKYNFDASWYVYFSSSGVDIVYVAHQELGTDVLTNI